MGLLSDLLGSKKNDNPLLGAIVDKIDEAIGAQQAQTSSAQSTAPAAPPAQQSASPTGEPAAPSGLPWGGSMPAEENSFNFKGSYAQYFEHVFREEFPEYAISYESLRGGSAGVFTFMQGDRKALIVELLSESSSAKKLRADCAAPGIPYLRYYYDHEGWWNTRSYVTERTRRALNG